MKLLSCLSIVFFLLASSSSIAQSQTAPADSYKPVLDRLQSIVVIPLDNWRAHAIDLPHGEDPALSTSDWDSVQAKKTWTPPSRWLRTAVTLPEKLNGYSVRDSRVKLDLNVDSNQEINVSIFANGNMIAPHRRRRPDPDRSHREGAAGSEVRHRRAGDCLGRHGLLRRRSQCTTLASAVAD